MKNLLIILAMHFSAFSLVNAQECSEQVSTQVNPVKYQVNKNLPKYLQGATITVRLANGKETTVPAERFMVVPRQQQFVVGQAVNTSKTLTCKAKSRKNSIMVDARRDFTGVSKSSSSTANSQTLKVSTEKALVPGLNYYRREVLDSHLGLGAGVDANGTLKALIGLDF